jgi:phenylacetate-CoA ligase
MKVAILSPYPTFPFARELGCTEISYANNATWTVALADHLARLPATEVHLVTESEEIAENKTITRGQLTLHFLKAPGHLKTVTLWQADCRRMHHLLREIDPDIVHGQGLENQYGFAAVRSEYPHLLTIHGIPRLSNEAQQIGFFQRPKLVEFLAMNCLKRAKNIVIINPFVAEYLRLKARKKRLFPICNPVSETFFTPTNVPREPNFILAIGWVDRLKGHDVLVEALAQLRHRGRMVRTVIAGPVATAAHRTKLQQLIQAEHLDVTFVNFLPPAEIANLMRRCTLFVHPSRHDVSPMSVAEAMACETPVIASRVGGVPLLIRDGETGWLFESENSTELAAKMESLLDDPATRQRLGQAAQRHAAATFAPAVVARLTRAAYEEVLRSTPSTPRFGSTFVQRHKISLRRIAAVVPMKMRFPSVYWDWRKFLGNAAPWPLAEIEAWQLQQAQAIIRHAYDHTSGYRELYRQAGVTPDDIRSLADIQRLPFVTKELIRDNLEAFSAREPGRRYVTTGGSTGIPFGFYDTPLQSSIESAFIHTFWNRVGWQLGMRNAVLRGGYVGSADAPWVYDAFRRELNLSSYYLTAATLPAYLKALRRYRPPVLQAYPSSLAIFCDLLADAGQTGTVPFDIVLLGSENIYDWQLEKFREALPGARLYGWYGHAEKVAYAPWCENSDRYHLQPFYGYTTVVRDDGREAAEGEEGELVATGFHSRATPFIRYRTMDRAVKGPAFCPACGRWFRLLERISGRSHEVIVTGTGRYISMTAINMHTDIFDALRQFQFYQEQPGRVVFRYVPKADPAPAELDRIRATLSEKLGGDTELSLERVASIPRNKSGKFSFLDQRLPIKYGAAE